MAHRGPESKAMKHGRTPNADWTEVPDVPYPGPWPELPGLPGGKRAKWNELALRWWDTIKVMPHCALWDDADWLYALETLYMKHFYFRDVANDEGTTSAATEIRRREDYLGTTMEARRKLRIKYIDAEDEGVQDAVGQGVEDDEDDAPKPAGKPGTVSSLADRRKAIVGKTRSA